MENKIAQKEQTLLEETHRQIERMLGEQLKQLSAQRKYRERLEKELQVLEKEDEKNLQRMKKQIEDIRKRKEEMRQKHAKVMKIIEDDRKRKGEMTQKHAKVLKQAKKALVSGTKHSRQYLRAALKIDKLDPVKDIVDNVNERDWYKSYKISCVRLPNGLPNGATTVYMLHRDNKPINGTNGKTIADVKRLMKKYPSRWYGINSNKRKIEATKTEAVSNTKKPKALKK